MPNISASSYTSWHLCNRLYFFEHVMKIERAREEGARRLGTLLHAGLEAWWRTQGETGPWREPGDALAAALAGIADNARHIETEPADVAKARAMMRVYDARYADDGDARFAPAFGVGVNDVERFFNLPLIDRKGREIAGWRITGKKDAIKRFGDGRPRVVEHKTTSDDIDVGSDYWIRLAVDTQLSMYIDAAQRDGLPDCREALYDVVKKPQHRRAMATLEADRRFTKGKGCPYCGGRAGGKQGVAQGTGKVPVQVAEAGKTTEQLVDCTACAGTGWKLDDDGKPDAPRLDARQRDRDESVIDYEARVVREMSHEPDAWMRQARIHRSTEQIYEMRDDLVTTTGIIGAMTTMARDYTGGKISHPDARSCFPRNSQACTSMFGRTCDFLDVCSGRIDDPMDSTLYQIKRKRNAPQQRLDLAGVPA